jgi:hypothetical protein
VYAFGGWALETVERYDGECAGRHGLRALRARARAALSVGSAGAVYVKRNRASIRHNEPLMCSVESMDPREGTWRREASMLTPRMFHAAAGAGHLLYAVRRPAAPPSSLSERSSEEMSERGDESSPQRARLRRRGACARCRGAPAGRCGPPARSEKLGGSCDAGQMGGCGVDGVALNVVERFDERAGR